MALIESRKFDLKDVVRFCPDPYVFNFSDMINQITDGNVDFENAAGFYVYRAVMVIDDRAAASNFATNLRLDFYDSDPSSNNVRVENAIESVAIPFEMTGFQIIDVPVVAQEDMRAERPEDERGTRPVTTRGEAIEVYARSEKVLKEEFDRSDSMPSREGRSSEGTERSTSRAKQAGYDPAELASRGSRSEESAEFTHSRSSNTRNQKDSSGDRGSSNRSAVNEEWKNERSLKKQREKIKKEKRSGIETIVARSIRETKDPPKEVVKTSKQVDTSKIHMLPTKRILTQDFYLDKKKTGKLEKIYVVINAEYDEKAKRVAKVPEEYSTIYTKINHLEQLDSFLQNPEPPNVELRESSAGRISFRLTRVDPTLNRVKTVKIIENENMLAPTVSMGKEIVFGIKDVIEFNDLAENFLPNRVTYRFAAVNGDGSLGGFSSVVVPSYKKLADQNSTARTRVSIFAYNQNEGIRIDVKVLTNKIFSMKLLREDMGLNGTFTERITPVPYNGNPRNEVLVKNQKGTYDFYDGQVVLGRKYRYFLSYRQYEPPMIASLSQEIISDEDEVCIRRFPYMKVPFNSSISQPSIYDDTSGFNGVEFDIDTLEQENSIKEVTKTLKNAGFDQEFISALQSDEVKAKNFIMYMVERYSCQTGRRASFGLIGSEGKFIDNDATRKVRNISPPTEGRYHYIFKMCMQDPKALLQTTNVAIVNNLGKEIQKKASRFMRRNFTRLGVMPAEKDVINGVPINNLIKESQVGIESIRTVDFPKKLPEISLTGVESLHFYNLVTWTVLGTTSDISYYNVFCVVNGSTSLLGAATVCPDATVYKFRDDECAGIVGTKSYYITATGHNGEQVASSNASEVQKDASIPLGAIHGVIIGSKNGLDKVMIVQDGSYGDKLAIPSPNNLPIPPGTPKVLGDTSVEVVKNKMAWNPKTGNIFEDKQIGTVFLDYDNFEPTGGRWFGEDQVAPLGDDPTAYGEHRDAGSLISQKFTFQSAAQSESNVQFVDEEKPSVLKSGAHTVDLRYGLKVIVG